MSEEIKESIEATETEEVKESPYKRAKKQKAEKDEKAAETKAIKDAELRAKIKQMEIEKRRKMLAENKGKVVIDTGREDNLIDFDSWWVDINRRVTIKPWMKEIVKADFKARGLQKSETLGKFDDTLRLFGIKF
jgi:hypothetical protein